jgi:hypothetical protein
MLSSPRPKKRSARGHATRPWQGHRRPQVEKAILQFMYRGSAVRRRRIPKNETAGESPDRGLERCA